MSWLKTVAAICLQNLRKWRTDYRIWTIAVLMFIMIQIYVDDMRKLSAYLETTLPVWIFPFLYSQFHTKLIYTLPVVMMFCNAPFTDQNQIFVYIRSGRRKWLLGQLLYIAAASALYYIFLFLVSVLSTVFAGGASLEWGETLTALSGGSAALPMQIGCNFVEISYMVTTYFTPLQAVWFTFLTSWLSAVLIGLVIFLFNIVSGTRALGVLMSSVLVVLSCLVANGGWPTLIPYSPISWNTLDNIDVGGMTSKPSFEYCMCVYIGFIALLTICIFVFGRKKSLDVKGD